MKKLLLILLCLPLLFSCGQERVLVSEIECSHSSGGHIIYYKDRLFTGVFYGYDITFDFLPLPPCQLYSDSSSENLPVWHHKFQIVERYVENGKIIKQKVFNRNGKLENEGKFSNDGSFTISNKFLK